MDNEQEQTQGNEQSQERPEFAPGDRVQIGREAGAVTEILGHGQARVRLDGGRTLKIDARLLRAGDAGPDAAKAVPRPPRNRAVSGAAESK